MNITKHLLMAGLLFMAASVIAKDKGYKKIFYNNAKTEVSGVTIETEDAVSTGAELKFKLRIVNNTNNYILYKPHESKFVVDGKEITVSERAVLVAPNESGSRVVNIKGEGYNSVKQYAYLLDGLYSIPADTKGIPTPDFMLPAARNDFKTGNFGCDLIKVKKESGGTHVRFDCKYTGDKVGFIFPSKVAVKMPDNHEYANQKRNAPGIMLERGENDHFTLEWDRMEGGSRMDMQKVDMFIRWNDAYAEVVPTKMSSTKLELVMNEELTNEKGR